MHPLPQADQRQEEHGNQQSLWGTAIDFKIVGFDAPGNTGRTIPKFIALLLPHFNRAGWFSGIAFHDTMHFEVSEEMIRKWSNEGGLRIS